MSSEKQKLNWSEHFSLLATSPIKVLTPFQAISPQCIGKHLTSVSITREWHSPSSYQGSLQGGVWRDSLHTFWHSLSALHKGFIYFWSMCLESFRIVLNFKDFSKSVFHLNGSHKAQMKLVSAQEKKFVSIVGCQSRCLAPRKLANCSWMSTPYLLPR